MKMGRTSEAATLPLKAEEPLVSHKSKAGSLSSETVNLKLIPETMKKPIAGKKKARATVSKPAKHKISSLLSFPIVGIGASIGGLEALEQFFSNIPTKHPLNYQVIMKRQLK